MKRVPDALARSALLAGITVKSAHLFIRVDPRPLSTTAHTPAAATVLPAAGSCGGVCPKVFRSPVPSSGARRAVVRRGLAEAGPWAPLQCAGYDDDRVVLEGVVGCVALG